MEAPDFGSTSVKARIASRFAAGARPFTLPEPAMMLAIAVPWVSAGGACFSSNRSTRVTLSCFSDSWPAATPLSISATVMPWPRAAWGRESAPILLQRVLLAAVESPRLS